ncbi:hypothetical protein CRE_21497 [Caenorhabditis remanei]|uniref:Tyrosine-protein phosphatase domain-containing protein n=1 Tax=Caenorhabditis remanei TaxID=31234 RepID=E3N910_CAERE|nr:hypothetical protein CRE_21497 [Caenorhabditis remanei]
MRLFVFLSVATATAIYATNYRRYYAPNPSTPAIHPTLLPILRLPLLLTLLNHPSVTFAPHLSPTTSAIHTSVLSEMKWCAGYWTVSSTKRREFALFLFPSIARTLFTIAAIRTASRLVLSRLLLVTVLDAILENQRDFTRRYSACCVKCTNFTMFAVFFPISFFYGTSTFFIPDSLFAANDALNNYLDHATIIAHIVNGIALQSGLINGSIPVNDVIGELLHLGSVDVVSIVNIKTDQVALLTQNVKKLPSELASDPDITKLESKAIEWDKQILEAKSVGDLQGLLKNQSYFQEAENLTNGFNFVVWTTFMYDVNSLEQHLADIEDIENPKIPPQTIIEKFQKLKGFEGIPKSFAALKNTMETLRSYKLLLTGPDVFQPLQKIINMMKTRKPTSRVSNENIEKIKGNIETILEVSRQFGASREDISKILELVKTRSNSISKTKKYAVGFPNGVSGVKQLEQDVRELWIGEILKMEVTKLNEFADGLKPLFNVNDRLIELDNQLKSLSSSESKVALSKFNDLQTEISVLTKESSEAANVLKEYPECVTKAAMTDPDSYVKASELLTHVKSLKDSLAAISSAVDQFDLEGLQKDTKDFVESVGFTDTTSEGKEFEELTKNVKASQSLQTLKNRVSDFKKPYDTITGQSITEKLQAIATGQNDLKIAAFTDNIAIEVGVSDCLKNHSTNSTLFIQAVQLIQKLRQLDTTAIGDVERVFSVISTISKELSTANTIPDTMKNDSNRMTDEINKLPDSVAKSEVIGQSVNSLRIAFVLRDLKAKIGELKTIDSTVQAEIQKILDQTIKKAIQQQWGDHKKEMAELNETLGEVESFEKKLNVSNLTTIGAYGAPLTALATLTSVTMNAKEKSKALGALLSDGSLQMNPTVKKTIEDGQKTLDQLADLDLGFASHSSQFQSAPGVFNALHDFLTKLLQIPISPTQPSAQVPVTQGGSVGASPIQLPLIIGITFGSLFAAGAMVAGGFFGYKKWDARNQLLKLVEWIMKHCFKNLANVKDVHCGYMQVMNANAELWRKKTTLAEDKKRFVGGREADIRLTTSYFRFPTQSCNPDTALLVPNGKDEVMVFANKIKTLGELQFIATHAPKDAAEFWKMTLSQNPEFIVSLCGDEEMKTLNCDYYPKKGEKPKKFGDFTVELTREEAAPNDVNKRNLTVTCGEKSLQLTHLQPVKWPANDVPDDHETAFELMKTVNKSKSPVIVHCSDGNDATMSFIGLQFIFEEVRSHPRLNFGHFMHEMCERTWHPIEKYTFSAWTVLGVRKHLYDEYKLGDEHKVDYDHDLKVLKDLKKEWIREDEERKKAEKDRLENEKKLQEEEDERVKKEEEEKAQLNKDLADLKRDNEHQEEYLKIIKKDNSELRKDKMIINRRDARERERRRIEDANLTRAEAERNNNRFEWVVKNYTVKVELHYKFHTGVLMRYLQSMKPDTEKAKECLPPRKHGFSKKYCNPDTAVLAMQDGVKIPIHANYVSSDAPNATKFIATQAPTKHDEDCDDTTADFWVMVLYHDSKYIINLCEEEEMKQLAQYYHPDPKQSVTCGGRYTIETVSVELVFNGEVKKRTLKVTDTEKEMSKTVYHFQFLKWVDQKIPNGHSAAIGVMEVVNKHKVRTEVWTLANSLFQFQRHVVVHCKAGVGRTMSFIGLQFVYEEIYNNPKLVTVMEPMRKMRELRWDAVQSVEQSFWIYLGVVLRLVRKLNLSAHYYDDQFKLMPAFSRKYEAKMKEGADEKKGKKDNLKSEEREKGGSDVEESVSYLSDWSSEEESDSGDETD